MKTQYSKKKCLNFKCLRNFLVVANIFFLIMGLIIATLPVYFHVNRMLKSWPINGGIIGMGALLVFLAIFGCYGSKKQHQIILFFYMVLLAVLSMITIAFAMSALTINQMQQEVILKKGWSTLSVQTKGDFQLYGDCCGFDNVTAASNPSCEKLPCYTSKEKCSPCLNIFQKDWFISFRKAVGGLALFVSLLMVLSVFLTSRYRHFKNPKKSLNSDEFL